MRANLQIAAMVLLVPAFSSAARLGLPAERAFETYVASLESRLVRQHSRAESYLASDPRRPSAGAEVRIEPVHGGSWQVDGGLLHHWRAAALVPGATSQDMLALLRDYDHLARYYAPEVISSRGLGKSGNRATLAMRFKKERLVTVVLDAEFETEAGLDGADRGYSYSRSTHIWQVDQPGTARERRRPEGDDDGFLWRLNSYWSFAQTREGLLIECEAVSLTRDIPTGLGWLILPIVEELPRASLEFTLKATRNALLARGPVEQGGSLGRVGKLPEVLRGNQRQAEGLLHDAGQTTKDDGLPHGLLHGEEEAQR